MTGLRADLSAVQTASQQTGAALFCGNFVACIAALLGAKPTSGGLKCSDGTDETMGDDHARR